MAYCKINKSGCVERKGHPQIRFDMFLEPDDPRYEDTYVQVPVVPAGGYPNKTNEDGTPVDQKDYDLWYASLPRIWQLNPFHTHFIDYYPHDFTDSQLKSDMDFHLANFYKAYQDEWDKVQGGMRHGFAVEKRIHPVDYSKTLEVAEYKAVQTQVIDRLNRLDEFKYTPIKLDDGKSYPATTIYVGDAAINREGSANNPYTFITVNNPANDTGVLDTVETWFSINATGFKVGTFSGSGTSYDDRDYETIGAVTSGSKQTFTGLSINVATGDFIGCYYVTGRIESSYPGDYIGVYRGTGDLFGTGPATYYLLADRAISLYATGKSGIWTPTITNSTGASNITTTSARLNGELTDDGGGTTTVTVYWGDNDGGTTAGNWDNNYSLGTQAEGTFYHDVSSLSSGTTYYYRYYASNSAGSDWADSTASFLTKTPVEPVSVSGSVSIGGTVGKKTKRGLAGAVGLAGSILEVFRRKAEVSGGLTFTGGLNPKIKKQLSGALTTAGTFANKTKLALSSGLTFTGILVDKAKLSLSGAVTSAGTLARIIKINTLSGSLTISGTLNVIGAFFKHLAGELTSSGTLGRNIKIALSDALTMAGSLAKKPLINLSGSLSSSGVLTSLAKAFQNLSGAITPTGGLGRKLLMALGGAVAPTGTIYKLIKVTLAGAVSFGGTVALILKVALLGTLSIVGAVGWKLLKALAGSIYPTGSFNKTVKLSLTGTVAATKSLSLLIFYSVTGAVVLSGTLLLKISKALSSTLTSVGSLVKSYIRNVYSKLRVWLENEQKIHIYLDKDKR